MAARSVFALVALVSLVAAAGACSDDPGSRPNQPAADSVVAPLTCAPASVRVCPCLTGGMGMQTCLATADGYGPCMQCPPATPMATAGTGGPPMAAMPDAGPATMSVDAATDAATDADAMGTDDAGPDAAAEDLGLAPQGTAPGVSCGVGLPVLCDLESEKCCTRSLRTDTCIEASASCDCDLRDCTVMEAFCDGPEDCPDGQVCCGTLAGGSRYERFECVTSCDYAGTQRIACHQDMGDCPGNNVCANSQLLTNLQVCIDPATIDQ